MERGRGDDDERRAQRLLPLALHHVVGHSGARALSASAQHLAQPLARDAAQDDEAPRPQAAVIGRADRGARGWFRAAPSLGAGSTSLGGLRREVRASMASMAALAWGGVLDLTQSVVELPVEADAGAARGSRLGVDGDVRGDIDLTVTVLELAPSALAHPDIDAVRHVFAGIERGAAGAPLRGCGPSGVVPKPGGRTARRCGLARAGPSWTARRSPAPPSPAPSAEAQPVEAEAARSLPSTSSSSPPAELGRGARELQPLRRGDLAHAGAEEQPRQDLVARQVGRGRQLDGRRDAVAGDGDDGGDVVRLRLSDESIVGSMAGRRRR